MADHRFTIEPPELERPRLVVMLEGWIDASGAAAAAMAAIEAETDAREIVTFDDDLYIDYRARRPTLEIRGGVSTRLVWTSPRLLHGRDANGVDVLLLTGPEPDMAWHRFSDTIGALAQRFGVQSMTALGAYPFATPHTRPTRVTATSPSPDMLATFGYAVSSVDVPAGVAAAIETTLHNQGIPSAGIWAQVPHYVAAMSYPAASVALLDALEATTGVSVPAQLLRREVAVQRERLDHLVASNEEHAQMVARLERLHDDSAAEEEAGGPALELRSGDEIAAEVERFLRDQK
ncbi:proteasome assembly chaperone family protein [Desertimonas flava]|uniref:proteasome assembly chaperone family protein n=1 Tax=Desertimonas flava TaxID=2064846 RepID=UPI000E34171E|nr:PAC2 family protein [Desertimonas flava]